MEEIIERPVCGASFHAEGEWAVPEGYEAEIKDGKIIVRKKESEDETIRKNIISFLESHVPDSPTSCIGKAQMINWLEKQEEQQPAGWTDADEKILERIIERLRFVIPVPGKGLVGVTFKHSEDTEAINWLRRRVASQPRPKQERSEEDERIRTQLLDFLEHLHSQGATMDFDVWSKDDCANWIAYLEKQKFHTEGDFGRGYDCGYQACLNSHGAEWFEKQKELNPELLKELNKGFKQAIMWGRAGYEVSPDGKVKALNQDEIDEVYGKLKESLHIHESCKDNADSLTDENEKIKNTIAKCLACGKRDGVINDEENILCLDWIDRHGAPEFNEDAATLPDKEEHQCDCEHVGCHINNCRRWCKKVNNEVPYEFCDPTCSGYSHKNTEGISVEKPTWTGNDSVALVSLEAIINNSNHDEARKKELFDWLLTRVQNGFSHTPEEKEFVRTIKSLVADFIYQKEEVDTSYYQRLVDWVEKRHIESIEPLWTPTEAQMWALQEAVARSCSSEYGGPLSEMLEMLNRSLGRKTAWEKCKPGATDDNAVAFVYLSPEAWKFAPAGTTFSEDVLLVCEGMAPRITRCAANNGYFLPISRTHPPKNVTDKLVAQYGESHGEPAPDNQNKDKNT